MECQLEVGANRILYGRDSDAIPFAASKPVVLPELNFGSMYFDNRDAVYRVHFSNDLAVNYGRRALRRGEYSRHSSGLRFSQKMMARKHHNHSHYNNELRQNERFYFANYMALILHPITTKSGTTLVALFAK